MNLNNNLVNRVLL